jgi:uncharacterized membrane protein
MTRSNKIRTALAATLAISAIAIPGLAQAAETKVTIKGENGDFYGNVKSSDPDCVSERKVVVYKQLGSSPDHKSDQKIASDITEPTSGNKAQWSVGNTGYKKGKFYARAPKVPGCSAATSATINS